MIRFVPDTWRDAVLRPLAMAAPDAGVYIETMAPDFRFVFVVALIAFVAALVVTRRNRPTQPRKPLLLLLALTAWAFVPWLATTGNGRYFMPFLLAAGPVCVGLVCLLPGTRAFRLAAAVGLLAIQGFAVYQSDSVRQWGLVPWRASYFQLDVPQQMRERPATYVTMPSISYSLIAPQFHPGSSWVSTAWLTTDRGTTPLGRRVDALLRQREPMLIVPSVPDHATAQSLPDADAIRGINEFLLDHSLAVERASECRLLPSRSLAAMPEYQQARATGKTAVAGFWACPLRYPVAPVRPQARQPRQNAVFERVETLCPRFFRPGEAPTRVVNGGEMREYTEADMRLYVMDDGVVSYRYRRSISAVRIGTVAEVLGGAATVDCNRIRGRSGLPWEREL